jgi:hypothetical protein
MYRITGRGLAWCGKARHGVSGQGSTDWGGPTLDFRITLEGTGALLMHNARLSNPLDPAAKAVKKYSSKRKKTDDDHAELAHLEFIGSLYYERDVGPFVPSDNIWRCLYDAAKKSKNGQRVKEGVFITSDVNPLSYRGPRDPEALWADENFRHFASAKIGMQRVTRCRPIFRDWRVEADGILDTNSLDPAELQQIAETAGLLIGLGDWRPKYGRFSATVAKL